MDRNVFALSLGLAGLLLWPGLGHATPGPCAPHDRVAAQLAQGFDERPRSMGLAQDGTVMELYASARQTWTLTVTLPSGMTCLVAAGDAFETALPAQVAKGAPA